MREHKFRGLYELTNGSGERRWATYGIGSKPVLVGAKWIVEDLEFTGLLDLNGKEIYEGDILKVLDYGIAAVEWDGGCSYQVDSDEVGCFSLSGIDTLKVIGNIYEHPDLLKAP